MTFQKCVTPIFLLFIIASLSAKEGSHQQHKPYTTIEKFDLSQLSPRLRAQTHLRLTKILLALSKKEKYPPFYKSRFSQHDWRKTLENVMAEVIKESHASNAGFCFFGGWPSARNGSCAVPWSSAGKAVAQSMGSASYNSDFYCGNANLFRCNPLVFGPGMEGANNGRNNNTPPYEAGVCVEIGESFVGLSAKCQRASEELDAKRVAAGGKPWREGDFFTSERAEDFKNIQGQIAELCRENRSRLNKDNMCDSLEKSLILTAAAVEAQKIANIETTDMFPQCSLTSPEKPECNSDLDSSYSPLAQALDTIKMKDGCSFKAVQAMKAGMLNFLFDNPSFQCHGKISISGQEDEFKGEDIAVSLFNNEDKYMANLQAKITPDMNHDQIVNALTGGDNKERFENACAETICPKSDNPTLKNLYEVLSQIKNRRNCNFGSVNAVDFESGNNELYQAKQCPLAIDGRIETEGLSENPQKVSVTIRDVHGDFLATVNGDITSDMDPQKILESIDKHDHIKEACQRAVSQARVDPILAAKDLGLSPDEFIAPTWNENNLLARIRNIDGLEDIEASFDSEGNLILKGDDVNKSYTAIMQTLRVSTHIPSQEIDITMAEEGLKIRAPIQARVEMMANKSNLTLSPQEKDLLIELGRASYGAHDISRTQKAADGSQYLVVKGSFPQSEKDSFFKENDELMEGLFASGLLKECPTDTSKPCQYLFTVNPHQPVVSE